MIFKYAGREFKGTRAEIQTKLAFNLRRMPLTWSHGLWHLGQDPTQSDCTPSKAKGTLIGGILEKVPEEKVLTASVSGDEIFVYDGRGLVKRVNIYDL